MLIRRTIVALGAAAALTLTACGSAEDAADGGSESTTSSESNSESSSGESADDGASGLTEENFISAVSDAQSGQKSMHLDMTMSMAMGGEEQEISASGDVEVGEDPTDPTQSKTAMTLTMPGLGEMEMILVDGVTYMNMGELTGGKFVEQDAGLGGLESTMSPNTMLEGFSDSLSSFEKTDETEKIDGVETTKYTMTIDGGELAEMAKGLAAQGGKPGAGQLPEEIPVELWIGEDDLMRKMSMTMDKPLAMSMEMTVTNWGEPVDIQAPPKSEITKQSPLGTPSS